MARKRPDPCVLRLSSRRSKRTRPAVATTSTGSYNRARLRWANKKPTLRSLAIGFFVGDTNGDHFVNAGDALQTRNRSGQATDATNFRSDVNIDGTINSGDQIVVRVRSGNFLL